MVSTTLPVFMQAHFCPLSVLTDMGLTQNSIEVTEMGTVIKLCKGKLFFNKLKFQENFAHYRQTGKAAGGGENAHHYLTGFVSLFSVVPSTSLWGVYSEKFIHYNIPLAHSSHVTWHGNLLMVLT